MSSLRAEQGWEEGAKVPWASAQGRSSSRRHPSGTFPHSISTKQVGEWVELRENRCLMWGPRKGCVPW